MNTIHAEVTQEEIASRAYEIWQSRGCPPGDGSRDWQAAEAELLAARVTRRGTTQQRVQSWWQRVRQKVARQEH